MNVPGAGDYINIHDHGAITARGVFTLDNIMVHEGRSPSFMKGIAYTVGAHPWHINENNIDSYMALVNDFSTHENVVAIGEAGFDRLKGGSIELQRKAFRKHVDISENLGKPLFIHCVRSYDTILSEVKILKPGMQWIIHGFNGKKELAAQLTGKGIMLSPWVEWAVRPVSADSIKSIPLDMLFLETDGFDIGIEPVYEVVASHTGLSREELRLKILDNYRRVFNVKSSG